MGFLQERFMLTTNPMGLSSLSYFILSMFVISILQAPSYAAPQSYIVYMGMASSSDPNDSLFDAEKMTRLHFDLLGSLLHSVDEVQNQMLYSYTKSINGFAAILDDSQVEAIKRNPEVLAVFPNRERKLHTTHSWNFLGLDKNGGASKGSVWNKAKFGEDVIIGNLDTGVWPESASFNDEGMGPVPARWKGFCQPQGKVRCNKKLIGARYFSKSYVAQNGPLDPSIDSARDTEGHGSHTLSTAGGSFVPGANVFGLGNGTAKGGSPKARVAAYKVCWPSNSGGSCYDADILAGYEAAISDGVDVISVSLGGPAIEFFQDGTALGAFEAVKKGITVVISAGNEGPDPLSVKNVAPWMLTVGASTMDRDFSSYVTLGNMKSFKGESLSDKALPGGKMYPLINSADASLPNASSGDAQLCKPGSLDHRKVAGKILVCLRGDTARVEKSHEAALAGAVGMILANDGSNGNELLADPHILPASHITFADGEAVFSYIRLTKNPTATLSPIKTELGTTAPVMAAFTSRGPNPLDPAIIKPDITAPGVDVIAAYTQTIGPSEGDYDKRRVPFITMSGTSMACPHVSGVVGILKSLHPNWSPAAIKSAIMTTAKTRANNRKAILDSNRKYANSFAYGSGHVQPNHAADPGLVYDLTVNDYLNYLCTRGYNQTMLRAFSAKPYTCPKLFSIADFNYPSIAVPNLNGPVTVTRRVKNVGTPGTYTARVKAPAGVSVLVEPNSLTFTKVDEEKTYKVTFRPTVNGMPKHFKFGQLIWSDGKHRVMSPLVVKHK